MQKSKRLFLFLSWLISTTLFMVMINTPSQAVQENSHTSVVFLMYHHVSEHTPRSTTVSPQELREHLAYLQEHDFHIISIHDAIAGLQRDQALPDKAVVLTFDDAYQDIFTNGFPILKEFQVPWTLFVTTDVIGEQAGTYMSWEQLDALHGAGVTLANHSSDHAHLPRRLPQETQEQWQQRISNNIKQAQATLEQRYGTLPRLFAYPYGEYNKALQQILQEQGYIAFGQHSGAAGSYDWQALPRFPSSGIYAQLSTLSTKMHTLAFPDLELDYQDTLLGHQDKRPILTARFDTSHIHKHLLQCFIGSETYSVTWLDEQTFQLQSKHDLPIGRSRYNCTAPSKTVPSGKAGPRYYWMSVQWIRPDAQGNWPD